MHNYHFIPFKTTPKWITDQRVFVYTLGKRPKYELLIDMNYGEIDSIARENGLQIIYYKYLTTHSQLISKAKADYDFLKEVAQMKEENFYDELAWQIFNYQEIDPIYIVRKFDEKTYIVWGYHAFHIGKKKIRFPFESLGSLNTIQRGSNVFNA